MINKKLESLLEEVVNERYNQFTPEEIIKEVGRGRWGKWARIGGALTAGGYAAGNAAQAALTASIVTGGGALAAGIVGFLFGGTIGLILRKLMISYDNRVAEPRVQSVTQLAKLDQKAMYYVKKIEEELKKDNPSKEVLTTLKESFAGRLKELDIENRSLAAAKK
jgi:hypothetical protein